MGVNLFAKQLQAESLCDDVEAALTSSGLPADMLEIEITETTVLGLEEGVYPAGAVHQLSKDRIYPYPKGRPFESRSLQSWGLDVYQGRVKPWTPPGVTTTFDDLQPTKQATRKVSINPILQAAGVKIKVAGRDEL